MPLRIGTKRAYERANEEDGARFLVDALWPRGVTKERLAATWLKDAAPSAALRKRFHHDPERWGEFRRAYAKELDASGAWAPIAEAARRGPVTLVYGARDRERNNAVALARYVEGKRASRKRRKARSDAARKARA